MMGILAATCLLFDSLTFEQQFNLRKAYYYGKSHDYGYTLAAIALSESSAGKFRINIHTNDVGLFQINVNTAYNTLGVTNYYRRLELVQRLIYDDALGASIAISVLDHFRRGRMMSRTVWEEMVMSYNEGYQWRNDPDSKEKAKQYLASVRYNVQNLRGCL